MRELGRAIKKGDIWTKASMLVMGAGYFARGQIAKGVIMTGMEVLFFYLRRVRKLYGKTEYPWNGTKGRDF